MTYAERRPRPEIAPTVLALWRHRIGGSGADPSHRVRPDGRADIVWIGDDPPLSWDRLPGLQSFNFLLERSLSECDFGRDSPVECLVYRSENWSIERFPLAIFGRPEPILILNE